MTPLVGSDFRSALRSWQFEPRAIQPLNLAIGLFVVLVIANILAQNLVGAGLYFLIKGPAEAEGGEAAMSLLSKLSVIGLFPAGIMICGLALLLARIGGKSARDVLSMHFPRLGLFGWLFVIVGFVAAVSLTNMLFFQITGINPSEYLPTSEGTSDGVSSAGIVEKVVGDLADEPFLLALALPAIAIFAPLAEELVFRGALFASLTKSPVGEAGALVITSALWALMHAFGAPWLFVSLIFLMGLILGALLLRFGNLWVPIVCHCVWNSMTTLAIVGLVSAPA